MTDTVDINHHIDPELVTAQAALSDTRRQIEQMKNDWKLLTDRLTKEANDRDWCSEYDNVLAELNEILSVFKLPAREQDYIVHTSVTMTYNIGISVKATNLSNAKDLVDGMDFDDIYEELSRRQNMSDYDDWNWKTSHVELDS